MFHRFAFSWTLVPACLAIAAIAGCSGNGSPKSKDPPSATTDAEIRAALDKLSPEDRKLAGAQKTCPITGEPLGSMGTPPKLVLNGRDVFVCCASCRKKAEAEPEKTLAKLDAAKAGK